MLNDNRDLFIHRLVTSAEEFAWAMQCLPPNRYFVVPPDWTQLGEQSPQRVLDQLNNFERELTVPTLRYVMEMGPALSFAAEEKDRWDIPRPEKSISDLIEELRRLRSTECAFIARLSPQQWGQPYTTPWGAVSMRWVTHKTYQNTIEQASTINGIVLASIV